MSQPVVQFLKGAQPSGAGSMFDALPPQPVIAWYPSAGSDFRPLLFLSRVYSAAHPSDWSDEPFPDLFLFTDYRTAEFPVYCGNGIIHDDGRTRIQVVAHERLPRLDMPLDPELVVFPGKEAHYGEVLLLDVAVVSAEYGEIRVPVVYAFVENESFCSRVLLDHGAQVDVVIQVRYGGGFGGARASGAWLLNVLRSLQCRCFVSDGHHSPQSGDRAAVRLYPSLAGEIPQLRAIRTVEGRSWSNHGDVTWYAVQR